MDNNVSKPMLQEKEKKNAQVLFIEKFSAGFWVAGFIYSKAAAAAAIGMEVAED
jgi:hypothetical protein